MLQRFLFSALLCTNVVAFAQSADAPPASPSFDCTKARGRIEKAICADPQLSALDRRVNEVLAIALAQAADVGDVKRGQRRWLQLRDDCKDSACLLERHEARLTELGALTGKFPPKFATSLCDRIVDPQTRSEILANTVGANDINNDGSIDRASRCEGGTANVPCIDYADDQGKPLSIRPDGFEWLSYSALGRASFRFADRTFVYYSRDEGLEQPAYVSYITPTNHELRVCDFETVVGSAVLEGGAEVCAAIEAADERLETLELAPINDTERFAIERRDTRVRAVGRIDIDNDGLEENLAELAYSTGAERGCDINYFELLAEDGASLATNSNAIAIRELQKLGSNGIEAERSCTPRSSRLIRYADAIYLDSNTGNATGTPHELRILEGEASTTVCTFERQIRTRVKTLY